MKKYFKQNSISFIQHNIGDDEIIAYRDSIIVEMKKMGASAQDIQLIHDATVRNSIRNKRKPEDVAWAILQ
ncbi:MAG: hypothetical protein LIO87_06800 [Eubacterium sp.]|nr:hypothetical protein [Eubacterium sp.]MCC8161221.1 hypothetical protein [Oscillospiraceae bacterium]